MKHRTPKLVILSFCAFASLGLPDGLLGVAWPSIRSDFRLPLHAFGILLALNSFGYLLSSSSFGYVSAWLGIGWVATMSCILVHVSLLGFAATSVWPILAASVFILGLGSGCIDAAMNCYAAQHFSPRLVSWLHASFGVGTTLGPLLVTSMMLLGLSWRYGYAIVSLLEASLAVCFVMTLRSWQHNPQASAEIGTVNVPSRITNRRLLLWNSLAVFSVYSGLEVCVGQWAFTIMTESRLVSQVAAGVMVSIYWGCLTLGRLISGWLVCRVSTPVLLRSCCLGGIASAILLMSRLGQEMDCIALGLFGLVLAPVYPLLVSTTPQRFPQHTPKIMGLQVAAAMIGIALWPSLAGVLARNVNLEIIFPFVLGLASLLFVLVELMKTRSSCAKTLSARMDGG